MNGYELSSGRVCVLGLSWESATLSDFNQLKKGVKSDDIRACFFEAGSDEDGQMVIFGSINAEDIPAEAKRSKGNPVSLAGLLAATNPLERIIAIQAIPDDHETLYWFCAINGGQVVADTDVVGSWDEIQGLASRYRSLMNDGGDRLIGDAAQKLEPGAPEASLEDFIDEEKAVTASIKGLVKAANPLVIAGALLFFLIAIGFSSYSFFLKSEAPTKQRVSPEEIKARQQTMAENALSDAKASLFKTADLSSAFQTILDQYVADLPVDALGWGLAEVSCTQVRCDAIYENKDLSPIKALKKEIGKKCVLEIGPQGESANCAITIDLKSLQDVLSNPDFALMAPWQKEAFTESLIEIGRTLPEAAYTIADSEKLSFAGSELIDISSIPTAGSFRVKSDLAQANELREILKKSLSLGYTAMTISLADGTIDVSGTYYEKGAK